MVKKILLGFICFWLLLFLGGCWDKREINDSAIPLAIGVDLREDKKIQVTALLTQPRPSAEPEAHKATQLISANDRGAAMAARRLHLSLSQFLEWAHVRTFVLGENLASQDLALVIDFMTRNRNLRPDMNLMICGQTKPEKLFAQIGSLGDGGLMQLVFFSERQSGIYTPMDIGEFAYRLTTPGIEPAVPMVILKTETSKRPIAEIMNKKPPQTNNKQEKIVLQGMAVFKGPKMVGILNEKESRGYRWLNSKHKQGGMFAVKSPLDPESSVALETVRFSGKTRPSLKDEELKMRIDIEANLSFYETTGTAELLTPETISLLEEQAGVTIKDQIAACIKRSQQLNSDILGWGSKIHSYEPKEWQRLKTEWNTIFPHVEADIHVKVHIKRAYLARKINGFK
ncbi:Spore germination GerAC [Syntrophomonas zehnderi OL-4]|uniref:Spore germination GerAC n=1 Tax=Syntrophomonas zehnderi OL-4 TaxID=690567 RepID=A0A0E4GAD8_9FIRM|nr:Ger(x)C family spore germination protein [Syntrophomonas zehnderi]CFX10307.1 Spore germination GerAC [Syntrophomonas zehnderi OL-4]